MIGRLPESLLVAGQDWEIRTDFRDILVIMEAYSDPELTNQEKAWVTMNVLYRDLEGIPQGNYSEALKQATWFIDCGRVEDDKKPTKQMMDWNQDEAILFPAINKVAHMEVRTLQYLHWWTFVGYFMEIEDGLFSVVLNIRQKKSKGKKLEPWEREFYQNNRTLCDMKKRYTQAEQEEMNYFNKLLG